MIGIILLLSFWSFLGLGALIASTEGEFFIFNSKGFEFVNPVHIYKESNLNIFGAIFVSILTSFICPIGTILYWFYKIIIVGIYKLCTVGRK